MAHSHDHHQAPIGVEQGEGGGPRWRQALSALRYHDFRLVWTTSIFSSAARWVQQVSLGWLAFDLTDSAALLGVLLFVYQAPTFVLSPLIGVLVDRVDRRRLLIVSQSAMAAVAVLLALDISLGYVQVWHLYVFAIVSGVESTIIHVVRQALIPAVVPRAALLNAISLNSAALTSTRIVGPFLAGLLIVGVGVEGNFLIQAALLTCVAIAAFPLRVKPLEPESGERSADGSIRQDIAIALRFIWSLPVLRVQFTIQYLMLFLAMPFSNFLPVWAANVLDLEADGLGVLYSAAGIGALVGTLALASAGNVQRKGLLMGAVTVALGLAYLGMGLSSLLLVSLVLLAVMGATQSMFSALNMTLVQTRVPDGLQGRVMSIFNVGHAMIAIGSLTMGIIVELFGIQLMTVGLGVVVAVLAVLALTAVPSLRRV